MEPTRDYDAFSINIDLYEKLTAVRRTIGLPTSDYLEKVKTCLKEKKEFIVKGKKVSIKKRFHLN